MPYMVNYYNLTEQLNCFSEWTEMFPYDFRDERMMKQLKEISQRVVAACPDMRRDISGITHNLLNKVITVDMKVND